MRLIDWDEVLEWMHRQKETTEQWSMRIAIENYVDEMPTVDAVPVVRCKDCKKYIPCQKLPIGTSKWCDLFDRATCEMNYCGWGERRDDEISD